MSKSHAKIACINDSVFYSLNYYYSEAYQYKCLHVNSIIGYDQERDKVVYNTTECNSWHFDKLYYQNTLTEDVSQSNQDAKSRKRSFINKQNTIILVLIILLIIYENI